MEFVDSSNSILCHVVTFIERKKTSHANKFQSHASCKHTFTLLFLYLFVIVDALFRQAVQISRLVCNAITILYVSRMTA